MKKFKSFSLKEASLDEVPLIVTLAYNEMNKYLEIAYNGPFDWETWEHELRGIIFSNEKKFGIVNSFFNKDNKFIGFWWITPYEDHLWIDAFVIKPQYQHQGIGSELVKNLRIITGNIDGIERIELGVQEKNNQAINFYKKHGFLKYEDDYLSLFQTLRMVKLYKELDFP